MGHKRQNVAPIDLITRSRAMRDIERSVQIVAPKEVTVTLLGESGAGKEVLARRVHALSRRSGGPFVPINCAAIPEALFESDLFGHERGAFTGATSLARGKIEAAEGGTLFLDEIGDMPLGMQSKLLRFLESRRYMRVGGSVKIDANVRLVCATLRPLEQEVRAGRFRADLYYRIQGISLSVPALRERRADILPLLVNFVALCSSRHQVRPPRFTKAAKLALLEYPWPGNVRELRNVVETVCLMREGKSVRPYDLPIARDVQTSTVPDEEPHRASTEVLVDLRQGLNGITERLLAAALLREGTPAGAARLLRVSTRTVQRFVALGRGVRGGGR